MAPALPDTAPRPDLGSVAILGRGRLGTTLFEALRSAGVQATLSASRGDGVLQAVVEASDIIILAVPDAMIAPSARRLAERFGERPPAVVHLSGALAASELADAAARGGAIGAFHPFLPFSEVRPPEVFGGATIGVEASTPELERVLVGLASALGARARVVPSDRRTLYHAAAVMASSYVVALAAEAAGLLEVAGFGEDEALAALLPLMSATLENLSADGLPGALSGPLRRGDAAVVERHLEEIQAAAGPQTQDVYRTLGRTALGLAQRLGLEDEVVERLRRQMATPPSHAAR